MKLKQTTLFAIALMTSLSMPQVVAASDLKDAIGELKDARKEVREERKDVFDQLREKTGNVVKNIVSLGKAAIIQGKITAKTDTTLTVEKDGKSYTVQVDSDTKLRRRFGGTSFTQEFAVGNTVNVYGTWTDDTKTIMDARLIRNISIQKRFGVFVGEVKSLLSGGWVMSTTNAKRLDQTVTVTSDSQITNRNGEVITQSDIKVGHRVRVKGLWDSSANTVTEVKHVKDFSLPAVGATVSITATATPTP